MEGLSFTHENFFPHGGWAQGLFKNWVVQYSVHNPPPSSALPSPHLMSTVHSAPPPDLETRISVSEDNVGEGAMPPLPTGRQGRDVAEAGSPKGAGPEGVGQQEFVGILDRTLDGGG